MQVGYINKFLILIVYAFKLKDLKKISENFKIFQ